MFDELKALKELLDMGAITQEEFDAKKAELLRRPSALGPENETVGNLTGSKSKVAAGLLALFLGALGAHKFYLGYTSQGVALLLLTLFGSLLFGLGAIASGVISLVEGIIYLTKTDAEFDTIYVKGCKGWF